MRTHTINVGDVSITVRPRTGMDKLGEPHMNVLLARHFAPELEIVDVLLHVYIPFMRFTAIVQQTIKVEGDLGFTMPTVYSKKEALFDAFNQLMLNPDYSEITTEWVEAIEAVNLAPNEVVAGENPTTGLETTPKKSVNESEPKLPTTE